MTSGIKVTPDVLEDIARRIDSRARNLEAAIDSVNRIIGQINTSRFQGVRADYFRMNYQSRHNRIRLFPRVLQSFSTQLSTISHQFRQADNRLAGSRSYRQQLTRLPGLRRYIVRSGLKGIGVIGGLGILVLPWIFRPPSWWPFRPGSSGQRDVPEIGSTSSAATHEFPPLNYDEMNWSTKFSTFDEMRKELADIERGLVAESDERINYLNDELNKLSSIITTGIPGDGPTNTSWVSYLGGCTHYIATKKRNVADFGRQNAHTWNDNALKAGYEVTNLPAPGSIVVFEANSNGYGNAGHVGYVESVNIVDGGYEIVFSHASTIRPDENSWVRGDHSINRNGSMTIPFGGKNYVSFIYGKL